MSNYDDIELDLWIGIVVASPTCHPARRSCYGFDSRTHAAAGGLQWGDKSVCAACVCMGFGVHTALIKLHPVPGSVEDGFELCRMYESHSSP